MSQEERNNRPSSRKKVKSSSGRKQGYKMSSWQKEIQKAACRERDLEGFNFFVNALIELLERYQGRTFIIEENKREPNLFASFVDRLYVLQKVTRKRGHAGASALVFFVNQARPSVKMCLKGYDLYDMIKNKRIAPLEKEVKKDFFRFLIAVLKETEASFPDEGVLMKNFSQSLNEC